MMIISMLNGSEIWKFFWWRRDPWSYFENTKEKCQVKEKTIIFRLNMSKNSRESLQSHLNEQIMHSVMFANVTLPYNFPQRCHWNCTLQYLKSNKHIHYTTGCTPREDFFKIFFTMLISCLWMRSLVSFRVF